MSIQWYTMFCKPRSELQASNYLRSNNIEVYNSVLRVKPVNPRAAKVRSYFPRYLFVHADREVTGASPLQRVPGAVSLVDFGGEFAVIPDQFIAKLQDRIYEIEAGGGLHLDGLKKGDPVQIKDGQFAGYEAVFDLHLNDKERVQVLLHWLGREMKVKLNASAVEKRRLRR